MDYVIKVTQILCGKEREEEKKMDFWEILKVIFLGIIEGITEWLPISSTGHMILLNEFVKLDVSEEFWSMFLVVIQLGAILAVVVLFWNIIWPVGLSKNVHEFLVFGLHVICQL